MSEDADKTCILFVISTSEMPIKIKQIKQIKQTQRLNDADEDRE